MSSQKQEWLFFCPQEEEFHRGMQLILPDDEHHYAAKVLRLEPGAAVLVSNCQGNTARGQIHAMNKRETVVVVDEAFMSPPPHFKLTLALALPRPQTLWDILPALSELGVDALAVFPGERTALKTRPTEEKVEKLLREGMRVSKAPRAPTFQAFAHFSQACAALKGDLEFFCDEGEKTLPHLAEVLIQERERKFKQNLPAPLQQIVVWIGPEASFSAVEQNVLRARPHTHAVTLGPRILRVPTAVFVATALVRGEMERRETPFHL